MYSLENFVSTHISKNEACVPVVPSQLLDTQNEISREAVEWPGECHNLLGYFLGPRSR